MLINAAIRTQGCQENPVQFWVLGWTEKPTVAVMCLENALCSEPSPEVLPSSGKDWLAPAAAEPVALLS